MAAPAQPRLGRYEACVTAGPPEASMPDGFRMSAPEYLEALDAFGGGGGVERAPLARRYCGLRVTVRRGWRRSAGQFEMITLLSPYPDESLSRLHPGTMVIHWIARPAAAR
jgi:hypothetical protein